MTLISTALNTLWMSSCLREARAFRLATRAVPSTQESILRSILRRNTGTEFGRQNQFAEIRSVADYQRRVPVSTYEAYRQFIGQIQQGRSEVLTRDPVDLLEPTSGTSGGEKLIPYTRSLRREFQRAVASWVVDTMSHRPAVRQGRAYWSLSPALTPQRQSAGRVPVGFDEDAHYLQGATQCLLRHLLITPPHVRQMSSLANFRYWTLMNLLSAEDLVLISVWSPTFLTCLLESLKDWGSRICDDLRRGVVRLPDSESGPGQLSPVLIHPRQLDRVEAVLRERVPVDLSELWPRLALISCWADGMASQFVPQLKARFPNVPIQPKGLLSTEACISFPLENRGGAALALRSHFFEFAQQEAGAGPPLLAHQLVEGREYRVLVTTGGGLYRYDTDDVVRVVGFEHGCPLLRFVGRASLGCDLVGEKLSESHVTKVLNSTFAAQDWKPRFAMLVPVQGTPPHYRLYLEVAANVNSSDLLAMLKQFEEGLRGNPYYGQARNLGQLEACELAVSRGDEARLWGVYERTMLERGRELGDLKPAGLSGSTEWPERFENVVDLEWIGSVLPSRTSGELGGGSK